MDDVVLSAANFEMVYDGDKNQEQKLDWEILSDTESFNLDPIQFEKETEWVKDSHLDKDDANLNDIFKKNPPLY